MTQKEYKEATKRVVVTTVLAVVLLVGSTVAMIHNAYREGTLYTIRGTVIEVDQEERTTTFVDTEGEAWRFKGIKDWKVNDSIVLTMNNNFTKYNKYDDKVIGARKGQRAPQ